VTLSLGPFRVRLCEVPHFVVTYAVELSSAAGGRYTFSADCRPNDELAAFAAGTDLLLAEATSVKAEGPMDQRGHLTAREAGELACAARAGRLVVTHFSDELDAEHVAAEATAGYGAPVQLAAEGAVYTI
jgi:ribonuclease BN (tRNA processing enzyme)